MNQSDYARAKQLVADTGKPSPSSVQRTLGLQWEDASQIMQRMETEGLVSAPDANGHRTFLGSSE
jgi:DNA segregation ATPase FtsK/SpoIIIE-like protein